jgi:YHS domain-containing protein
VSNKLSCFAVALACSTTLANDYTDDRAQAQAKHPTTLTNGASKAITKPLTPWAPVDASFNGCSEGFCGTRGKNARAVIQPGAKIGDYTYCIVSGAVFQVKESHSHTNVNGKTVYFCCEGCARYFEANRQRVLEQRGLSL